MAVPRALGPLLLLLATLPARAQPSPFADPGVWTTLSIGGITWAQDVAPENRDNLMKSLSVNVAWSRWMAQGGIQSSRRLDFFEWGEREWATFRSVYAVAGPWTQSTWFMGGLAVGPVLTWGVDESADSYFRPGLVGSVQGFARLDGRVWLGGETMAVLSPSSSHLASRLAIRIDLIRPDR